MRDIIDSQVVLVAVAILVAVLVLGLFGWLKFKRDEKIVIEFLKSCGVGTRDDETTTTAISSATRISEARIRRICGKSTLIKKDREDRESWKLH